MKILLIQPIEHLSFLDGASKANRMMIEGLARSGHECRVLGWSGTRRSSQNVEDYGKLLHARGIAIQHQDGEVIAFEHQGVTVRTVLNAFRWHAQIHHSMAEFQPDCILVSEDHTLYLLEAAMEIGTAPVVYVAHSQASLPFGPESFVADRPPERALLLQRVTNIITVSHYVKSYIERWGKAHAEVVYFPAYGSGPFPRLGGFDSGHVAMINPSLLKGISIFLELARRFPRVPFAAIPTWATTQDDRDALARLPNMGVWPPVANIDELYARIRVLLVPSLWGEAFGQVAVEAMLRGVPVLASNVGGLPEAKLKVDYVLPVQPINQYEPRISEKHVPVPVVPPQDVGPWEAALGSLLGDRARYEALSQESRSRATAFVESRSVEPFEAIITRAVASHRARGSAAAAASAARGEPGESDRKALLARLSPAKRALLAARLRKTAQATPPVAVMRVIDRAEGRLYPLSFSQERYWLLQQLDPTGAGYNTALTYRITGRLDTALLRQSIQALVDRHEALRIVFALDGHGRPFQRVLAELPVAVPVTALPDSGVDRKAAVLAHIQALLAEPFDLTQPPLLRVSLLALAEDEHIFVFVIHHINFDGWSAGVLARELCEVYRALAAGRAPVLPELAVQYIDYAVWQRGPAASDLIEPQLAYWRKQLAGDLPVLHLPFYRPRPKAQSFRGAETSFELPQGLVDRLSELGQRVNATLFMTLLAGFKLLVHRYTRDEDIVVGTLSANRDRPELERLVGLFLNSLVLRTAISGNPRFIDLLTRVRDVTLDAYAHQQVPVERLLTELRPQRDASHQTFFQVLLVLQNAPTPVIALDGLALEPLSFASSAADLDMEIQLIGTERGLAGKVIYNTDLVDQPTVARFMAQYRALLESIAGTPEAPIWELSLLSAGERAHLLEVQRGPAVAYPLDVCMHTLIERQALATPDAVAVELPGGGTLTYGQMDQHATRLARRLQELGVGPAVPVAVCLDKRPELIVVLLAVLKAGGAYVPVDAAYPAERIAYMLGDCNARLVCTTRALGAELPVPAQARLLYVEDLRDELMQPQRGAEPMVHSAVGAEHPAYIIYTSGSTGMPKGVVVRHRTLVHYACAAIDAYQLTARDRMLQFTSISWDTSAEEIFPTLLSGATLLLRPPDMLDTWSHFLWMCERYQLTILDLPTAFWHEFTAAMEQERLPVPESLRLVIIGGERVSWERVLAWRRQIGEHIRLMNTYGCTETTIVSTFCDLTRISIDAGPRSDTPIGRAIANVRTYVLDPLLQPVPPGMPGELCIGGEGLALGYLGQPALTASKFVPDAFSPEPGARMYRTGDLVRMLPDGTLECLGRVDKQVKVRGFRIEPAEIEAVLAEYPGVLSAVVGCSTDATGQSALVAYAVVDASCAATADDLRRHLAHSLPEYMVPGTVMLLDAMPLMPSGKIDHARLPVPTADRDRNPSLPPRDATERRLAAIWQEVMGIDALGIGDDFFELGGHSLMAVRLISRVESEFGRRLSLAALLQMPTIEKMAAALRTTEPRPAFAVLIAIQSHGSALPLFFVPGSGGNVLYLQPLAESLGRAQPFYGLQSIGLDGHTPPIPRIEDMAARYIQELQAVQPQGPYFLGGHSFGSSVAYEMAYQLEQTGHAVALVAAVDNPAPFATDVVIGADWDQAQWIASVAMLIERVYGVALALPYEALRGHEEDAQLELLLERLKAADVLPGNAQVVQVRGFIHVFQANTQAGYVPRGAITAPVVLFRAEQFDANAVDVRMPEALLADPTWGWQERTRGRVAVRHVPGDHLSMMTQPHVASLAAALGQCIEASRRAS